MRCESCRSSVSSRVGDSEPLIRRHIYPWLVGLSFLANGWLGYLVVTGEAEKADRDIAWTWNSDDADPEGVKDRPSTGGANDVKDSSSSFGIEALALDRAGYSPSGPVEDPSRYGMAKKQTFSPQRLAISP